MFKKICSFIGALALVSTTFVATVSADAAKPTMYLDYEVSDDGASVDIITKVKDLPSSHKNIYDETLEEVKLAVFQANFYICIDDAASDLAVPTSTNLNIVKRQLNSQGYPELVSWGKVNNVPYLDKKYLAYQGNQGNDPTKWTAIIDENGTVELSRFTLKLNDANKGADTVVSLGKADIAINNLNDSYTEDFDDPAFNENQMWGFDITTIGYQAYNAASDTMLLEDAAIKISGKVVEKIPTATEAGEKDATAIGDTYYGDTDTTDTAVAYGVGLMGEENKTYTNVLWTVTANGETKYHKSPVDVSGDATYKIGLVIQGLTKDMVTAVKAVLQ